MHQGLPQHTNQLPSFMPLCMCVLKDYLLNKLGAVRGVLDSYSVKSMLPELVRHTTRGPLTQLAYLSAATAGNKRSTCA